MMISSDGMSMGRRRCEWLDGTVVRFRGSWTGLERIESVNKCLVVCLVWQGVMTVWVARALVTESTRPCEQLSESTAPRTPSAGKKASSRSQPAVLMLQGYDNGRCR